MHKALKERMKSLIERLLKKGMRYIRVNKFLKTDKRGL